LRLDRSPAMLRMLWMAITVLFLNLSLPIGEVFANKEGNWDKLLLVPGYFGKGISSYPALTPDEEKMIQAISELPYLNKTIMVLKEKGEYYCFIRCFLGVYRWDGVKWTLYSGGKVTGYNCSSYEFFQDGGVYQFSGRGYWQSNSDLFVFGENLPAQFVRTDNQPADYYGWLKFKTEEGIYSIFGIIDYDKIQTLHLDPEGYVLDLRSWTWKKTSFEFNDKMKDLVGNQLLDQEFKLGGTVETHDFALLEVFFVEGSTIAWLIFDKKTAQIYFVESSKFLFDNVRWLQTEGNLIRFLTEESAESRTIDLSEQVKSAVLVGKIELKEGSAFSEFLSQDWFLLSLGGIAVLVVLWLIWRWTEVKFNTENAQASEPEIDFPSQFSHWLKGLSPHSGQLISQAQLEVILGVENVKNQDLRKVRRSRAIKAINEHMLERHGKPIIQRVRDEQDMRIIRYYIEDDALEKSIKPSESEMLT